MCFGDPVTMSAIAGAATAMSTALGVAQGIDAASNAKKVGQYNALLAEQQRDIELERGKFEERRRRRLNRQLQAQREVGFGASGSVTTAGSPIDVLQRDSEQVELDALAARWSAERNAEVFDAQAEGARYAGRVRRREALFGAGTTLLTGLGSSAAFFGNAAAWQTRLGNLTTGAPDPSLRGPLGIGGP